MRRRGGIILEAVLAILLLSLLTVSVGKLMTLIANQSRQLAQRAVALQECHLALASIEKLPSDEFSESTLNSLNLAANAAEILPEGDLQISLQAAKLTSEGTRIQATVRWRPTPGADLAEATLFAWRFDVSPKLVNGREAP
jgi:Tfp pilus assembly protein PilX